MEVVKVLGALLSAVLLLAATVWLVIDLYKAAKLVVGIVRTHISVALTIVTTLIFPATVVGYLWLIENMFNTTLKPSSQTFVTGATIMATLFVAATINSRLPAAQPVAGINQSFLKQQRGALIGMAMLTLVGLVSCVAAIATQSQSLVLTGLALTGFVAALLFPLNTFVLRLME